MTNDEWQEAANRTSKDLNRRDKNALEFIMGSPEGRWFIGRLLDNCHIYSPMSEDRLHINEGERRIGLLVRNNIMAMDNGLNLFHQMEEEMAQVAKIHEQIRKDVHEEYEGG